MQFFNRFSCFLANDRGATAIEYAILCALISLVAVLGFQSIGVSLGQILQVLVDAVEHVIS